MPIQCTDAEWKIMVSLWEHHPRTMADITQALEPTTGWTKHTVMTLLKRMQEKGSVAVDESGSVKNYSPLLSREEASSDQTKKLLSKVFSGNASLLINNLVETGEITVKEMQALLSLMQNEGNTNSKY